MGLVTRTPLRRRRLFGNVERQRLVAVARRRYVAATRPGGDGRWRSPQVRSVRSTERSALRRLAEEQFDVLVIGAGVVGAGAALDAASRGLKVALVEARDFASGTSSRSSKLVHGGLRYLKQLNFHAGVRGAAGAQADPRDAVPAPGPAGRVHLPAGEAGHRTAPTSARASVSTTCSARAAACPATSGTCRRRRRCELFRSRQAGRDQGRHQVLRGPARRRPAHDDDRAHRRRLRRRGRVSARVVDPAPRRRDGRRRRSPATWSPARRSASGPRPRSTPPGVWTDEIQEMIGGKGQFRVRASKGVHIVVPRDRIDSDTGLITETEKSLLFIIPCPWSDDFWVIGTTDTPWDLDLAHPAASSADIDYILEHANALLAKPLTRDDVVGVYAGLRPLLAGESDQTSKLSREHAVRQPGPRPGDRGRRQVHDLPGDGQGRRRPRRRRHSTRPVAAVHDRRGPAGRRRRATRRWSNTTDALAAAVRAARRADRAPAGPLRIARSARSSTWSPSDPELGEPLEHAPRYLKVEAVLRGLARGCAAPRRHPGPPAAGLGRHLGPRRRRRPARSPRSSRRSWAGTTRRSSGRSSTTAPGSPPSATRRTSSTTGRPTPLGSGPPRSGSAPAEHHRRRSPRATPAADRITLAGCRRPAGASTDTPVAGVPTGSSPELARALSGIARPADRQLRTMHGGSRGTLTNGQIFLYETLGTAMLLLLGCGVVATAILREARVSAAAGCSSTSAGASPSSPASTSRSAVGRAPEPGRHGAPSWIDGQHHRSARSLVYFARRVPRRLPRRRARLARLQAALRRGGGPGRQARGLLHRPGHPLATAGTSSPRSSAPSC